MQANATKSKSKLGWSRQRPKFRTRRFHRILALALVAANVLGAGANNSAAAVRQDGPGPAIGASTLEEPEMATPPVFDGEYLDEELVASIATHPYLHWEACRNRLGNAIDDCVIIAELETMESIVTRIISADACTAGGNCHGGYSVLQQHSTTYDSVAPYGSTGMTLQVSGDVRIPAEGRFWTRMEVTQSSETTITVARGYMHISHEVFDASGNSLDAYVLQMNAGTAADVDATIDCDAYAQTVMDEFDAIYVRERDQRARRGLLAGPEDPGYFFPFVEHHYGAAAKVRKENAVTAARNFCEDFNSGYTAEDDLPVCEIDPGNEMDSNDYMSATPCPEGMVYAPGEWCYTREADWSYTDERGALVIVDDEEEVCYDVGWICVPM